MQAAGVEMTLLCMLTTQEALLSAAAVIVSMNREDAEWAKYRSNNACVGVLEGAGGAYSIPPGP